MRRTPLRSKRPTPRRNGGRITHERMKPKSSAKAKSADEKRHMDRVAKMPCLVTGCNNGVQVHHVVSDGLKRITKTHKRVVPLCSMHHADGPQAVHRIGHARFTEIFGIDLLAMADQLWEASCVARA